ncbi:MAG: hypothetical protein CMO01_13355 [Thalassobius sp.]|nr:hypothetical protein [Thalassovita sp.]
MKNFRITLPVVNYKKKPVSVGITGKRAYVEYNDGKNFFILNNRWLMFLALLIIYLNWYSDNPPEQVTKVYHIYQNEPEQKLTAEEVFENDEFLLASNNESTSKDQLRKRFLIEKQKLIFSYTTKAGVSRTDQLSAKELLALNRQISELFQNMILGNVKPASHVYHFFTDTADLNKLETALMEQAKFHVPASITLAQAALETSYGRRIIHNNYFGIKDKTGKTSKSTTTEYYTAEEAKKNAHKIINKKLIKSNGKTYYKCLVKDNFEAYRSPWASFRAHSIFLASNSRYYKLFTGGKNYEAWADKIGSSKHGGVGYATSPLYGNLLKSIISRYHLDLLDH